MNNWIVRIDGRGFSTAARSYQIGVTVDSLLGPASLSGVQESIMDDVPRMSREKYVETMRTQPTQQGAAGIQRARHVLRRVAPVLARRDRRPGETIPARRDRIRLHEAAEKIANLDGAPWIRNQIRGQSLPLHAVGLDFYHLAEHVQQARRAGTSLAKTTRQASHGRESGVRGQESEGRGQISDC